MLHHSRVTAGPRCTVCGKAVAFLGPEQPERAWAQRWVPARAKRRSSEGGGNWSRGRRPLLVEVDPYGSDTWRLDPIIALLQDGAVRKAPARGDRAALFCVHTCMQGCQLTRAKPQ